MSEAEILGLMKKAELDPGDETYSDLARNLNRLGYPKQPGQPPTRDPGTFEYSFEIGKLLVGIRLLTVVQEEIVEACMERFPTARETRRQMFVLGHAIFKINEKIYPNHRAVLTEISTWNSVLIRACFQKYQDTQTNYEARL